jgi:hypothetical protein
MRNRELQRMLAQATKLTPPQRLGLRAAWADAGRGRGVLSKRSTNCLANARGIFSPASCPVCLTEPPNPTDSSVRVSRTSGR